MAHTFLNMLSVAILRSQQYRRWDSFGNNKFGTVIVSHFNYVSNVDYFMSKSPWDTFECGSEQIANENRMQSSLSS